MSAAIGWGLALLAFVAGYVGYGWRGVALAATVVVFWLLLQFSRSLRVLREAAGRPVGSIDSAVMLHARMHAGMRLPQLLRLTRSLGRQGAEGADETFTWTDAAGDSVTARLRDGQLQAWTLHRAEPTRAEADGPRT